MHMILAVAAGGAIGAVVMVQATKLLGMSFPWGTLTVNIVGSFLMGALIEIMALIWSPSQEMRAFLAVGVLGAFTTFSTFSLDAYALYERGQIAAAASYVVASVVCSLAGLLLGLKLLRVLLT